MENLSLSFHQSELMLTASIFTLARIVKFYYFCSATFFVHRFADRLFDQRGRTEENLTVDVFFVPRLIIFHCPAPSLSFSHSDFSYLRDTSVLSESL